MYENPYAVSLETQVFSATPVELVRMLIDAAVDSVRAARRHLADGNIPERSRLVNKTYAILVELYGALDRERGGELSQRLAALYAYMQQRLLDANFKQSDDGLAEVERLLLPLQEAWQAIGVADRNTAGLEQTTPRVRLSNRYAGFDLEPLTVTGSWSG
ncbi:MAG: flagellar export chaperone FliS [Ignavibacteriota bacterium]